MITNLRNGAALAALALSVAATAQPVPIGITAPPLSDQPYVFDTAEQHKIKLTVIAKGFPRPFAIEFTPDGDLLLQERGGPLRVIRNATAAGAALDPAPIPGMPTEPGGIFSLGVQDISLHPDFASNHLIYFTYNATAPVPEGSPPFQRPGYFRLMRGKLENGQVSSVMNLSRTGVCPARANETWRKSTPSMP